MATATQAKTTKKKTTVTIKPKTTAKTTSQKKRCPTCGKYM